MSRQRQQGCRPLRLQVRAAEASDCPAGQCRIMSMVSVSTVVCWQDPVGGQGSKILSGAAAVARFCCRAWSAMCSASPCLDRWRQLPTRGCQYLQTGVSAMHLPAGSCLWAHK